MSPNTQSQLLQIWRSSHLQKRIVHANRQMRKTQWTLKCQGSWQSSPKRLRKLLENKQISQTHNPFNAPLKPIIKKRDHSKKPFPSTGSDLWNLRVQPPQKLLCGPFSECGSSGVWPIFNGVCHSQLTTGFGNPTN